MLLGVFFVYGHLEFFSVYSSLLSERSAFDGNLSVFQKLNSFLNVYFDFFGQFGINPLNSLFVISSSLSFGYGLLKSKEWSRKLGFLVIFLNIFSSLDAMFFGAVSFAVIVQLGLCAYMWWILTSDEAKGLLKKLN
jgi:hypothetical protein